MTNAVIHIRLLRFHLETRVGQEETTQGILLISGWRVRGLRVTGQNIHIDFPDFTSQRVWKEDLSSSDRDFY